MVDKVIGNVTEDDLVPGQMFMSKTAGFIVDLGPSKRSEGARNLLYCDGQAIQYFAVPTEQVIPQLRDRGFNTFDPEEHAQPITQEPLDPIYDTDE